MTCNFTEEKEKTKKQEFHISTVLLETFKMKSNIKRSHLNGRRGLKYFSFAFMQ